MLLRKINERRMTISEDGNHITLNEDCDVMIISDFHFDYKKDRPQYFWELIRYLDRLIDRLRWLNNPVCIFLGDIFNKDLNMAKGILYFEEVEKRFNTVNKITDGKCYAVYGNHEDTYLDIIPSARLLDVSEHLKEVIQINKGKKINRGFGGVLKTPQDIRIHNTKISLFHFNKFSKDYSTITGDSEFHIGLFHDTFVNNTLRNKINGELPVDLIWKRDMRDLDLNNLDLAVFGDFHIPVPPFKINNRRNTAVIICGSYGRNNIRVENYSAVKLPIIEVRKDLPTKVRVIDFVLDDFRLSYNLGEKMKNLSDINNRLRKLTGNMKEYSKQEITLQNFSSFIYSTYGEEWGNKVYKYMRDNLGSEILANYSEETNGRNNDFEETAF